MHCPVANGYNRRLLEYFNVNAPTMHQDYIYTLNGRIANSHAFGDFWRVRAAFCCELTTLVLDDISVRHVIDGTAPFPCDEGLPLVESVHAAVLHKLELLHLEITERRIIDARDAEQISLSRLYQKRAAAIAADRVLDSAVGTCELVGDETFVMLRALWISSDDLMAVSDHLESIQ